MHISNQNHSSSAEQLANTFGKKNKKESVMDALMKLGEPAKEGGKKTKTLFSLEENRGTKSFEKADASSAFLANAKLKNQPPRPTDIITKMENKTENKVESLVRKMKQLEARSEKTDKTDPLTKGELGGILAATPVIPIEKQPHVVRILDTKKEATARHSFAIADVSKEAPKPQMTLRDIQQERQIFVLKDIAKQLSEKETSLPSAEVGKVKTTFIQLPLGETTTSNKWEQSMGKAMEGKQTIEGTSPSVPTPLKEMMKETKKTREFEGIKTEAVSVESKAEFSPRQEPMKVETVRDIKSLITQEIEPYVELKEVNAKKVTMTVQHAELGNVGIQVERKDDKIYILLRVEEGVNKEKMEQTLEQLKQDLKEKDIDVEYEVESEGQQKEKRKEQEGLTEKENKRENQGEQEEALKFDELLEVGL